MIPGGSSCRCQPDKKVNRSAASPPFKSPEMQRSASPTSATVTQPLKAIALMCVAWVLFACLDATAKYLAAVVQMPASQAVWMRFLGQFVAMVVALGLLAVPRLLQTNKLK